MHIVYASVRVSETYMHEFCWMRLSSEADGHRY